MLCIGSKDTSAPQNYAPGDEDLGALYGYEDGRLQKLQCLKAKYDPTDVLRGIMIYIPLPAKGTCHC
jgi:hypothetical protein